MKKNNKGFSLVELIIVIAIMAILAGAIAPALIRYIDKSRKSNDVTAAKALKTAVETAMTNEDTYEALTTGTGTTISDLDNNSITYAGIVKIEPAKATAGNGTGVTIKTASGATIANATSTVTDAQTEMGKNIGEKTPKIAYKKDATGAASDANKPVNYAVLISNGGSVIAGLTKSPTTDAAAASFFQLAPTVSRYYQ